MDTLFRLEMLGRLGVRQGSREIRRFRTQKTSALLAYLAFYKRRSHPREVLIDLFWPDSSLDAGRTNLSVALNALRKQLEEPGTPAGAILMADRSHVRLNPDVFTTDADEFDALLHDAELETELERRIAMQVAALDLYRGDLLPGLYEDWILTERDRLRDTYLFTLRQVVKGYAETRQYERAIEYAHRMVQADPLREGSYHNLMRLYLAVGRPEDALYQYQTIENLLQKELQAVPSAPLRELADKLRQTPATSRTPMDAREAERDLTTSPAKSQPTSPVKSLPAAKIPLQFTRYFGQEALITHLTELLVSPSPPSSASADSSRLITLTGPGGTGKTRLAIEVAWRVKEEVSMGIWFVALAELRDPLRLGEALRDALELPRQSQPSALDQVVAFLNGLEHPSLLILDNLEQILEGGASLVWTLLNRVPTLRCLVTSRRPLSLPGEQEIPVFPLPTPNEQPVDSTTLLTHVLTYPSVALFVDRAQAARPEFQITPRNAEAIAAICAKLEGVPLAIELAAARVKALTPSQIMDRLAHRFELLASRYTDKAERHRSLWAAVEWSYLLLPPDLQQFFARLGVFRGGWNVEAAEAVCATPMALDYLSQLRGHSLVFAHESSTSIRFGMLETIREFALEQLTPEERQELEWAHADYFVQSITGPHRVELKAVEWFERFEEDIDNLRTVLAWSLEPEHDLEMGHQLAGALHSFWRVKGHYSEARRWYSRLLERSGVEPTIGRGRSLYGAGTLASLQGDFSSAHALLEECLNVFQTLGNETYIEDTHTEMGSIAYREGDYDQARSHYENALILARKRNNRRGIAVVLGNLANIALSIGNLTEALALNRETLEIWREIEDPFGEATTLNNIAIVLHAERKWEDARSHFEQSLQSKRKLGDRPSMVYSLYGLASVTLEQGDFPSATTYALEALALTRELGARSNLVDIFTLLIELMRATGELRGAARMYGALEKAREEMNYPIQPSEQEKYEQVQRDLQQSFGKPAYDAAWLEGVGLTLEQAVADLEQILESGRKYED